MEKFQENSARAKMSVLVSTPENILCSLVSKLFSGFKTRWQQISLLAIKQIGITAW